MVLVDGVKFACQSCIKGHRSSKCTHTSRTLIEIKKKGRPTSQCSHCRDLRRTRAVHGRCDCAARELEAKPQALVLQNGLTDIVKPASPPPIDADAASSAGPPKGRVAQLLNPCNCRRGGKCNCCSVIDRSKGKGRAGPPSTPALSDAISTPSGSCCSPKTASSAAEVTGNPPPFSWSVDSSLFQTLQPSAPQQPQEPFLLLDSTSTWPPTYASFQGFSFASDLSSLDSSALQLPQSDLGLDVGGPVASSSGGCCGSKTAHSHQQAVPTPSQSLSAVSAQFAPSPSSHPSYSSPIFYPTTYAQYPIPTSQPLYNQQPQPVPTSHTPLFLPSTQGTAACFCGEACTCVGCPQHDPYGRKGQVATGCGTACQCDVGKEQTGAPKACCGGGSGVGGLQPSANGTDLTAEQMMRNMVEGCAMNLPQLWTDNPMASTIAPQQSTTLSGLPSLSQIWGDVGGLDLDFAMGGSTNAAQQQFAFQHGTLPFPPDQPLSRKRKFPDQSAVSRSPAPPTWNGNELAFAHEGAGCSAMYADEVYEGGCGDACTCSSDCGCRTGVLELEGGDAGLGEQLPRTSSTAAASVSDFSAASTPLAGTPMTTTTDNYSSYAASPVPAPTPTHTPMPNYPHSMSATTLAPTSKLDDFQGLTASEIERINNAFLTNNGQMLNVTPRMGDLSLAPSTSQSLSLSPLLQIAELAAAGFP